MTDAATKIVKATELNIGRRAEEYYYIHLDDLLTTAEGNNPQKIPTLGTLAMVNAKKAALALKKEAEKKAAADKLLADKSSADKSLADKSPADKKPATTIKSTTDNKTTTDKKTVVDKTTTTTKSKPDAKVSSSSDVNEKKTTKKDKKKSPPDPNKPIVLVTFTQTDFVQCINALRLMLVNEVNMLKAEDLAEMSQINPTNLPAGVSIAERNYIALMCKFGWLTKLVHSENSMEDLPQCATDFIFSTLKATKYTPEWKAFTHNYDDAGYLKNRFIQELAAFKQYDYIAATIYEAFVYFIKVVNIKITNRAWYQRIAMCRAFICGEFFSAGVDHYLMENIITQFREVKKKPSSDKKKSSDVAGDTTSTDNIVGGGDGDDAAGDDIADDIADDTDDAAAVDGAADDAAGDDTAEDVADDD